MRLVIDPQHITEALMLVGTVELPLTISREQLVEILFPGHHLVPATATKVGVTKAPRPISRRAPSRVAPVGRIDPHDAAKTVRDVVVTYLGTVKGARTAEIRAIVESKVPGTLDGLGMSFLSGMLGRLVTKRELRAKGERGERVYSVRSKPEETASPRSEAPPSSARKGAGPTFPMMTLEALASCDAPVSSGSLTELIEKRHPGETVGRHPSSTAATLKALHERRQVKRTGETGTFLYAISKTGRQVYEQSTKRLPSPADARMNGAAARTESASA